MDRQYEYETCEALRIVARAQEKKRRNGAKARRLAQERRNREMERFLGCVTFAVLGCFLAACGLWFALGGQWKDAAGCAYAAAASVAVSALIGR